MSHVALVFCSVFPVLFSLCFSLPIFLLTCVVIHSSSSFFVQFTIKHIIKFLISVIAFCLRYSRGSLSSRYWSLISWLTWEAEPPVLVFLAEKDHFKLQAAPCNSMSHNLNQQVLKRKISGFPVGVISMCFASLQDLVPRLPYIFLNASKELEGREAQFSTGFGQSL